MIAHRQPSATGGPTTELHVTRDRAKLAALVFVRDDHLNIGESGFTRREVAVRASDANDVTLSRGLRAREQIAANSAYALLASTGG